MTEAEEHSRTTPGFCLLIPILAASFLISMAAHNALSAETSYRERIHAVSVPSDITEGLPKLPRLLPAPEMPSSAPERVQGKPGSKSIQELIRTASPAVVMIKARKGTGTGFNIRPQGLVVTNAHVMAGVAIGGVVGVVFENSRQQQRQLPGILMAMNYDLDIALIQLPPAPYPWPALPGGDSQKLEPGDRVLALGHPFGLMKTPTVGYIAGVGYRGPEALNHIQHSAQISPGNSGGPLLNDQGQVVGVNTFKPEHGSSEGISFAVPNETLRRAVTRFFNTRRIDSAWMGLLFYQQDMKSATQGIRIDHVRPGSPAAKAGLKSGDNILGVRGKIWTEGPMQAMMQLRRILLISFPGDAIELHIQSPGGPDVSIRAVTLIFGAKPSDEPGS